MRGFACRQVREHRVGQSAGTDRQRATRRELVGRVYAARTTDPTTAVADIRHVEPFDRAAAGDPPSVDRHPSGSHPHGEHQTAVRVGRR